MHRLLQNFIEEEKFATDVLNEIKELDGQGKDIDREYNFNVFDINIYFLPRTVSIVDILDASEEGEVIIPLDEFIEALESKVKKSPV